ncbi:Acyl-CoA dehydrogenase [Colletotrichum sp. SAR 10_65]|nr:Acyl-CoA dehydrogenase [Colletotrichum sp. SAR 10_65]
MSRVPFADPPWLRGLPSPYFSDSHRRFQVACRKFIDENLNKDALEWETSEEVPPNVFKTFADGNFLLPALPAPLPVEWLRKLGITHMPGQVPIEEWDYLHTMIYSDERLTSFFNYYSAGSDVANITTTAELQGNEYIVNGTKKWITNGVMADYATLAVRTGGEGSGAKGISLLVVALDQPGVSRRRLKVSGQIIAGTSFIELSDVRVPRENLIGRENEGMKYIMHNFNHERMFISVGVTRQARVALSSAFAYVLQREAFGKSAWVESFAYQLSKMPKKTADEELGGLTSLCKANAGIVLDECARCAVLLFGGNGYTRTGKGEIAEKIYREVPGARIPGGSEDVLLDLAIRQLTKRFLAETEKEKKRSKL